MWARSEVEVAREGLVDRLDDLSRWFGQRGAGPFRLAVAGRLRQPDVPFGEPLSKG
ncbi:hypothetical protein GCM10027294_36240 [Marinactinospora endophytica]